MNIFSYYDYQTIVLLFLLFCLVIIFIILNKSSKIEKRISKYSIKSLKKENDSFFDILYYNYMGFVKKISNMLVSLKWFKKTIIKYEKYSNYKYDAVDYVAIKLIFTDFSTLCVLIYFLINMEVKLSLFLIPVFVYFFIPLFFKFKYLNNMKKIENQLYNAIVIMNNSFKTGKSTIQAFEDVINQTDNFITGEFQRMYKELDYGLSMQTVFERFYERTMLEDVKYVFSSLVILSETGGNIVDVFSNIETFLKDKKRINFEFKALTSGSYFMVKFLSVLPFAFGFVIYIFDSNYFDSLFSTFVGNVFFVIIVILYSVYIFIISKVMKVKL